MACLKMARASTTITFTGFQNGSRDGFADTFYWIALTDSKEADHRRATQITEDIVTTDEILPSM